MHLFAFVIRILQAGYVVFYLHHTHIEVYYHNQPRMRWFEVSTTFFQSLYSILQVFPTPQYSNTGWRMKCHTIDCAHNTFLLLQKHLTSGTELILVGWKIVPNEEHVQCDHRFAS